MSIKNEEGDLDSLAKSLRRFRIRIKEGVTMKVLITGGAGFIGSHAAEYFLEKYSDVKAILYDAFLRSRIYGIPIKAQQYNIEYLKRKFGNRISFIQGDIRNYKILSRIARNVDVIIHTAAQVAVTTSLSNPRLDFEINVLGTLNVLEVARQNDTIVVYCSTNKVYGDNVNKIPIIERETRYEYADPKYKNGIPENFPIDQIGHTPYGCSKLAADLYVQDYYYTYGLKTAVFRMSCIYGERQFGTEDQGWVAWFVIATLVNKTITIYGNGKQVRDILYVRDLIKAWDQFINARHIRHGVYNIGGGPQNTLSLLELLQLLQKRIGKRPKVRYAPWRPKDQKVYISGITKAMRELRWRPTISPLEGIQKLINWVKENIHLLQ